MGYPYPGGPYIDKLAKAGNPNAIEFPLALRKEHSFDFSFSGLKSAVINYIHAKEMKKVPVSYEDVAASFQKAVVNALLEKTMAALDKTKLKTVALAGGVAANSGLREAMEKNCLKRNVRICSPAPGLCTDNGAMIGCRAYYMAQKGDFAPMTLNADPRLPFLAERGEGLRVI